MDSPDLDGLLFSFDDKISDLCGKLALLHRYKNQSRDENLELNRIIGGIQYMILNVSSMLEQQEELLLSQIKRCEDLFTLVEAQSEYIEANVSSLKNKPRSNHTKETNFRSNKAKNEEKPKSAPPTGRLASSKDNVKFTKKQQAPVSKKETTTTFDDPNKSRPTKAKQLNDRSTSIEAASSPFPEMMPLSKAEFDSIPSYMLGRLKLDILNNFVAAFNCTIFEKYKFINSYSSQTSNEESYKRIQMYKSQENSETKDAYFCTVEDIKELSSMKNDSTIRKVLLCLRHCRRVKENRGNPPKLIRYILLN